MIAFRYRYQPDRSILERVTAHYQALQPLHNDIITAYRSYIRSRASTSIAPLPVNDEQRAAFKLAYSSRATSAGLGWINELYENELNSCPFCGGLGARTIEHYLPFASYPEFAVFSPNLVPSCGDCNRKRNDQNKHGATPCLLHPYFDRDLIKEIRLLTDIDFMADVPRFILSHNSRNFDQNTNTRIAHHLKICVDQTSFRNFQKGQYKLIKSRAMNYTTIAAFIEALTSDLDAYTRIGEPNSWSAALMRGILNLSLEDQLIVYEAPT